MKSLLLVLGLGLFAMPVFAERTLVCDDMTLYPNDFGVPGQTQGARFSVTYDDGTFFRSEKVVDGDGTGQSQPGCPLCLTFDGYIEILGDQIYVKITTKQSSGGQIVADIATWSSAFGHAPTKTDVVCEQKD